MCVHTHVCVYISLASDDNDVMHIFSLLKSQTKGNQRRNKNKHRHKKQKRNENELSANKMILFCCLPVCQPVCMCVRANKCWIKISITDDDRSFVIDPTDCSAIAVAKNWHDIIVRCSFKLSASSNQYWQLNRRSMCSSHRIWTESFSHSAICMINICVWS